MSYDGNYASSDGQWNGSFREHQGLGRPTSGYGSDPFGANHGDDEGFSSPARSRDYMTQLNDHSGFENSHLRFGRPPATDFAEESDYGGPAPVVVTGSSPPRYAASGPAPYTHQYASTDRYRSGGVADDSIAYDSLMTAGGFGGDAEVSAVPTSFAGRAQTDLQRASSRDSTTLSRSMTDRYGRVNDDVDVTRFLINADGTQNFEIGVGVMSTELQDPYPSLRTGGLDGDAYPSASLNQGVAVARRTNAAAMLPPKKEATPLMPPSLAVELDMPRPKVSRRYLHYAKQERQPDLAVAKQVKNARYKAGDDDMCVLKCPNCQSFLKIPKMAVLMQCPTCSTVSPATSSSSSHQQ